MLVRLFEAFFVYAPSCFAATSHLSKNIYCILSILLNKAFIIFDLNKSIQKCTQL